MSDTDYLTKKDISHIAGVISESLRDELQIIHETLGDIQAKVSNLPTRDEFNELKTDMRTIRAAVTDTNRELHSMTPRDFVAEEPEDNA